MFSLKYRNILDSSVSSAKIVICSTGKTTRPAGRNVPIDMVLINHFEIYSGFGRLFCMVFPMFLYMYQGSSRNKFSLKVGNLAQVGGGVWPNPNFYKSLFLRHIWPYFAENFRQIHGKNPNFYRKFVLEASLILASICSCQQVGFLSSPMPHCNTVELWQHHQFNAEPITQYNQLKLNN